MLPAADDDPIVRALHELGWSWPRCRCRAAVRTNYTLTEPDGTTTKLNEPGTPLDDATRAALADALHRHAAGARWVALSGSLPARHPGGLVRHARRRPARHRRAHRRRHLGGAAAGAAGRRPRAAPDLLKPNTEELAQLAGVSEEEVLGDPAVTLAAVRSLHDRGVAEVLLTLGGDGAVLSTADGGLWSATCRRSPCAAPSGPATAAWPGYLLADLAGAPPAERLRTAVAYGSAAASMPGSAVPTPAQVDGSAVQVTAGCPVAPTAPRPPRPSTRARLLSRPPAGTPLTPPGEVP